VATNAEPGGGRSPKAFLVEGLVIVVSILLAFGIDALWGEMQENRVEARVLDALESDFAEFSTALRSDFDRNRGKLEAVEWLLDRTGPEPPQVDSTEFIAALGASVLTLPPNREVGALRELLAGPGLALIDDEELRGHLSWWVQEDDRLEVAAEFAWDFAVDYRRWLTREGNLRATGIIEVGASRFPTPIEEMLGSREFENHLFAAGLGARQVTLQVPDFIERADTIVARIRELRGR